MPRLFFFALTALLPFGLICLGALLGGAWAVAPLLYMAGLTAALDQLVTLELTETEDGQEFPGADMLLVLIAMAHLLAFPLVVWAIAGPSGLPGWARLLLGLGAGQWFGQVSNPCAHELIHRGNRGLFWLGATLYATMLFGHHTSAHRLVHHRFAASSQDPNTARLDESYYRFWPRAWAGSFRMGWQAEAARRGGSAGLHPYWIYGAISLASLAVGYVVAGWAGVFTWAALAIYAHSQLLLADYVQHYGLLRATGPDGVLEPVSDHHSWNAPQWFSSGLMLNAPRHSDHHAHPSRPYPALRLPARDNAPYLPYALPVCCSLALVPRLWRRVMARHLHLWRQGQAAKAQTQL